MKLKKDQGNKIEEFLTKSTKEEKITKKREGEVFVQRL